MVEEETGMMDNPEVYEDRMLIARATEAAVNSLVNYFAQHIGDYYIIGNLFYAKLRVFRRGQDFLYETGQAEPYLSGIESFFANCPDCNGFIAATQNALEYLIENQFTEIERGRPIIGFDEVGGRQGIAVYR